MRNLEEKKGIQVQSVARAIGILRCFEGNPELGISEIASMMSLNKSTAFGLVNTLATYGLLEQIGNKKYRLGISLFELGNLAISRLDIRSEAREVCAPLSYHYPAAIHIAVHSEGEVIYLDKLNVENNIISVSNVGRRAPMHCTGVGKAMLAYLPKSYLDTYLTFPLPAMTANTITSREALEAELEQVRQTGIAVDDEEIEPGLYCIAAPVFRRDGTPAAAISLSFPMGTAERVDLETAKKELLGCTHILSARLGYQN